MNISGWKRTFRQKVAPLMNTVRLTRWIDTPVHCVGGWNTDRNEYDYIADAAYHATNPTVPVCRLGLLGEVENYDIKGFYSDNLTASQMFEMNFGTLDAGEGFFIVDGYTDLTNAISMEYPAGTYRSFIFIREFVIGDVVLARYAKVRKMETP